MFVVPCIMGIGGPSNMFAVIGVGLYVIQAIMIVLLIYRIGCLVKEIVQDRQESAEENHDEEDQLNRQIKARGIINRQKKEVEQ